MTCEDLNNALYEKMLEEQENYRGQLRSLPAEEILNHAYEYCVRENILMALEYNDLEADQVAALLRQKEIMPALFGHFEDKAPSYMDVAFDCLTTYADTILQKEHICDLPVYRHTGQYAMEHNDLEQFRASRNANIACKGAIEDAINNHYSDNRLDAKAAVQVVADRFGYERMHYVLAVTVRALDWDDRISSENKEWAKTVPVADGLERLGCDPNAALVVDKCHLGLTDLFVTAARKEYARTHTPEGVDKSVK